MCIFVFILTVITSNESEFNSANELTVHIHLTEFVMIYEIILYLIMSELVSDDVNVDHVNEDSNSFTLHMG